MALQAVESWDDDLELEGPIFSHSVSTHQASISSRLSFRSESNAAEDDWHVDLTPNDDQSTSKAIFSAKQAGIPLPLNVPASALLGGSIKKLGKKKSHQDIKDDWGDDLDLEEPRGEGLKLKTTIPDPQMVIDEEDGFSDWAEGSLGIRTAGTRAAVQDRTSSVSALSPSMGSVGTLDSEDDGFDGLVIPTGPLNFEAALKKRQDVKYEEEIPEVLTIKPVPKLNFAPRDAPKEDFFAEFDMGVEGVFDLKKRTLNRNVKPNWKPATRDNSVATKTQTTITFTDKNAATRIPRPSMTAAKPARLEPLFEGGAANAAKARRLEPTTTSAQLLRSKRSMSGLQNQHQPPSKPPPVPFIPQNKSYSQLNPANSRVAHYTSRRESDSARPLSPPLRAHSRLSHAFTPDTPTRQRRDYVPSSLAREAATKRTITRPSRRRNFGDGSELDTFDDLPTSAVKESKFIKQPVARPPPKMLRTQPSLSKLALRDKMTTPLPPMTPRSPNRAENLPRFARDTAASRIAREQKLGNPKPKGEVPASRPNWAAQVAARTPHSSPTANRIRRGPILVAPMGKENVRHFQDDAAQKGMHWNAALCRWEGNEGALLGFDTLPPPSPPRPALITNFSGTKGVQVVGGMVFDPQRMCWLKMGAAGSEPHSPSLDEDDDPFRDIEDLKESKAAADNGSASGGRGAAGGSAWLVGEEFDLGPEFIRRQREEEVIWRSKVKPWFGEGREGYGEEYKWTIRDIAATVGL